MNLQECWIGDELEVISSGGVGTFEGMHRELAMVKIEGKVNYFQSNQLKVWEGKKLKTEDHFEKDVIARKDIKPFEASIDLHLEALPDFLASRWPYPLDFQRQKCRSFVQHAVAQQVAEITIIHGVGEGVLKSAVLEILDGFPQISSITPINQGGAFAVRLLY